MRACDDIHISLCLSITRCVGCTQVVDQRTIGSSAGLDQNQRLSLASASKIRMRRLFQPRGDRWPSVSDIGDDDEHLHHTTSWRVFVAPSVHREQPRKHRRSQATKVWSEKRGYCMRSYLCSTDRHSIIERREQNKHDMTVWHSTWPPCSKRIGTQHGASPCR